MSRTEYIEYEFELEEFFGERFFATIWIEAEAEPGEPMVRYYADGSGYPGSPATVWPIAAKVTSLSGANWDKTREELEAFLTTDELKRLDDRALDEAIEAVEDGWLADHLFEELAARSEPDYD